MKRTTRTAVIVISAFLLLVTVASLWAQQPLDGQNKSGKANEASLQYPKNTVTRVFPIKYVNPEELTNLLTIFPGGARFSKELKVLTWTGPAEFAPAIEEAIKRIDVAPAALKSIDTTFYLLVGSKAESGGDAVPTELTGVTKQLRETFGFKSFIVWDTIVTRCVEGGRSQVKGVLPGRPGVESRPNDNSYNIKFFSATLRGTGSDRTIRFDNLEVEVHTTVVQIIDGKSSYSGSGCSWDTSLEVKEGQKAVVGKANTENDGKAIFLVVTAKVSD